MSSRDCFQNNNKIESTEEKKNREKQNFNLELSLIYR